MTMDLKNSTVSSSTPRVLCCNLFIYWQMETWVTIFLNFFFKAITTDFFWWTEMTRVVENGETHGHAVFFLFFFLWSWNLVSRKRHLVSSTSSSESTQRNKGNDPWNLKSDLCRSQFTTKCLQNVLSGYFVATHVGLWFLYWPCSFTLFICASIPDIPGHRKS